MNIGVYFLCGMKAYSKDGERNALVSDVLTLLNSGLFSIEKAYKNLGPKQVDCYWRFAVNAGTERTRIILYCLSLSPFWLARTRLNTLLCRSVASVRRTDI